MTENQTGCIICGEDLVYSSTANACSCSLCGITAETTTCCQNGHFVCDNCHAATAVEAIHKFALATRSTDPFEIATKMMAFPSVKMHGPEHHFIVPAALMAAVSNLKKETEQDKRSQLDKAQKRAGEVKGGFCGFHGACGAAVGCGIFTSVWLHATPLSKREWRLANHFTGKALIDIAEAGGPRCCKRNTFIALERAVSFLEENSIAVIKPQKQFTCTYFHQNKQCLKNKCRFFPSR